MKCIQEPAFLVDTHSDQIVFINSFGESFLSSLLGTTYSSALLPVQSLLTGELYRFEGNTYSKKEINLECEDKSYKVVIISRQKSTLPLLEAGKELAGSLVHVFRSPLSGILGFTDLMKNQGDENQQRYASNIEGALKKMTGILDDVEKLATINGPQLTSFKPEALLVDVLLDYNVEQTNTIDVQILERNTTINSDYVLVRAILKELISNALEFGAAQNHSIELAYKGDGIFSLTSFGSTISSDTGSKLFYPFFSTKGSNAGLGLTKAAIFTHTINGDLILSSNSEKEGVCFELHV